MTQTKNIDVTIPPVPPPLSQPDDEESIPTTTQDNRVDVNVVEEDSMTDNDQVNYMY